MISSIIPSFSPIFAANGLFYAFEKSDIVGQAGCIGVVIEEGAYPERFGQVVADGDVLPQLHVRRSHHDPVLEVERRGRADADRLQVVTGHSGVCEQGFASGNHRGQDVVRFAFFVRDAAGRDERSVAEDERNGDLRAADVETEDREWFCHDFGLLPEKMRKKQKNRYNIH